jgi:hypothetical protein
VLLQALDAEELGSDRVFDRFRRDHQLPF